MEKKSVVTKIQKREEYFVQFTPEEMELLGIRPRDKFEVTIGPSNSVVLRRMESVEIDLSGLGVETLAALVKLSVERQVPADEVITDLLREYLETETAPE